MKILNHLYVLLAMCLTIGLLSVLQAKDEPPPIPDQDRIFSAVITSIEQKLSVEKEYQVNFTLWAQTKDFYDYTDLTEKDISITDGNPIEKFEFNPVKAPQDSWNWVILLDVSKSMKVGDKIVKAKAAVSNFIDKKGVNDQVLIMTFHDNTEPVVGFTNDEKELVDKLGPINVNVNSRKTKLYDAIVDSANRFDRIKSPNRAVIVITDGVDIGSTTSFFVCCAPHMKKDIKIYTFPIGKGADKEKLKAFSDATGGRMYSDDPEKLSSEMQRLLDKSTGEYNISYKIPTNTIFPQGAKEPAAGFKEDSTRAVLLTVTDRSGAKRTLTNSYSVKQLPELPGEKNHKDGINWALVIGISVLVLGLIFAFYFLFRRRKHPRIERSSDQPSITKPDQYVFTPEPQLEEETEVAPRPSYPITPEQPAPSPPIAPSPAPSGFPYEPKPAPTAQPWGFIEILEAPDNPDMKGKLIGLTKPEMVIGKGTVGVDITLPGLPDKDNPQHDKSTISHVHCNLKLSERRVVITDLGSTNGVFIAKERVGEWIEIPKDDPRMWDRIASNQPVIIVLADLIRLGRQKGYYIFRLRLPSDQIKVDETLIMNP